MPAGMKKEERGPIVLGNAQLKNEMEIRALKLETNPRIGGWEEKVMLEMYLEEVKRCFF